MVLERISIRLPRVRAVRQHDRVLRRVVGRMQLVDSRHARVIVEVEPLHLGVVLAEEQDVAVVFLGIVDVCARNHGAYLSDLGLIIAAFEVSTNQNLCAASD